MPSDQLPSLSSQGRHNRLLSQSQTGESSRNGSSSNHHRDKTKSSGSYPQRPRGESSKESAAAQLAANIGATQARRPSLKTRAHSAPLVPKNRLHADEDDREAEPGSSFLDADPGDDDDIPEEDEIADDPFFTRFNFPSTTTVATSVRPDEEPPSPDSRDDGTDTEGPLSPTSTQMRARPDSTAAPLGSPLTPRTNTSVRPMLASENARNVIVAILTRHSSQNTAVLAWRRSTSLYSHLLKSANRRSSNVHSTSKPPPTPPSPPVRCP